jgi:hypothetical protein
MDALAVGQELRAALDATSAYAAARGELVDGFVVDDVSVHPRPNPFSPKLVGWRGLVTLRLRVVYQYADFRTGPPDRTNLDELHAAVAACVARQLRLRRPRIRRWTIRPDDYPAPAPDTPPDLEWTVTVCIDAA